MIEILIASSCPKEAGCVDQRRASFLVPDQLTIRSPYHGVPAVSDSGAEHDDSSIRSDVVLRAHRRGKLPDAAFRMIVDMTADAFVVIEVDGTVLYVGGSIERLLGWRPDQILGHNMARVPGPGVLEAAAEAIAEIDEIDRAGQGVPMVFELLRADGTTTWVEIGAMPLLDVPGVGGIALRLRAWDGQHEFDEFLNALLADKPIDDVLGALCQSIAASLEAGGVVVHHGFDGVRFSAASGFGVPVADLPLDRGPWWTTATTGQSARLAVGELEPAVGASAAGVGMSPLDRPDPDRTRRRAGCSRCGV